MFIYVRKGALSFSLNGCFTFRGSLPEARGLAPRASGKPRTCGDSPWREG